MHDEMKDIKKISHGKYFRLVLTNDGKLFFQGQSRKYNLKENGNLDYQKDGFLKIPDRFFRNDEDDKLVDVVGGKSHTVVMTEKGRVFATGYTFYREFSGCRSNTENYEDTPYELKLPEGYTGKAIFGSTHNIVWVNATNADGKMQTLGNGTNRKELGAINSDDHVFRPLLLPDGIYFTKISSKGQTTHAIDNECNLWVFGDKFYAKDSREDRDVLYEEQPEVRDADSDYTDVPKLVKWFKLKGIKILDVDSGDTKAIVKAQDKDGNIVFYALQREGVDSRFVGGDSLKSEFKDYISKVDVQSSRVKDFAMGHNCVFLVMGADKEDKVESIDPDHPQATGLIHFYQTPAKEWKFVTEEQYAAQKDTLPDVCFATRHPIKSFLDRVKRLRANEASQEDKNDKSLPDLN